MAKVVYVLNGPNLNLLGKRQPEIYGSDTLVDIEQWCRELTLGTDFEVEFKQSNAESELIDWIQDARTTAHSIIINAGAYTHTSIAILDALNMFDGPVIEVHISNIKTRENFRHQSYISYRADKEIIGKGTKGYLEALATLINGE